MLHITASSKTLREELRSAINIVTDIRDYLYAITTDTSYHMVIGNFVKRIPEYKVLARDAEAAKQLLRKVCTGEISVANALEQFNRALKELTVLENALDPLKFPCH